jgi:hypothetical protein
MGRALLVAALALVSLSACSSCPPDWADRIELVDGYRYASASVGELSVDVDPTHVALTRAARRLADALGIDVENRLSVVRSGEQLFVEARGAAGVVHELDALEFVELAHCGPRTHARVRLAVR